MTIARRARRRGSLIAAVLWLGGLGPGALPAYAAEKPLGLPCSGADDGRVEVCQWNRAAPDLRPRSWDGVPLDVRVVLPAGRSGPVPLVVVLGGYPGGLPPVASSGTLPSQIELARRGYGVLVVAPRGTFHSCGYRESSLLDPAACLHGYVRLADSRYEVRDVQHLAGLLVDEGYARPRRIGVAGDSYGGGQALQLAVLRDRIRLPSGEMRPWRSPSGTSMRIAGVTASNAWDDLGYALVPNGRLPVTGAASADAGQHPPGIMKASLYTGFEALGIIGFLPFSAEPIPAFHPPPGSEPSADFYGWGAALKLGEPYGPTVRSMLSELRANHSAAGIPFDGPPAPVLMANGFADDLFPVDQAVRYLERANAVAGAHTAAVFGDWGHGRSRNRELDVLRDRSLAWLDRWVQGDDSAPVHQGIEARVLDCFGDVTPVRQARDWHGLGPDRRRYVATEPQLVVSPAADAAGAGVDPMTAPGSACAALPADDQPGTATYRFPAPDGFTILGSPAVTAELTIAGAPAADTQIAVRLWDVDTGSGEQRLVSRTLYRPKGGLLPEEQRFELHGTGWRVPRGHELKLEVLGADAPFGRPSNVPFGVEVRRLQLDLPVWR